MGNLNVQLGLSLDKKTCKQEFKQNTWYDGAIVEK